MTNTFKTARGATIELVTEEIKSKIINTDGHEVEVSADGIAIKEVIVNGTSHKGELIGYQGQKVIRFGWQGKNPLLIAIPADIYETVWGEYDRRTTARLNAELDADKRYNAHTQKIMKAMEE